MTYQEINQMVKSIGLPYAYRTFTTDDRSKKPKPPYIIFFYDSGDDLYADNSNYQRIERLSIELYTDNFDPELKGRVENTLKDNGLTYRREEVYLEDERMLMNSYEMEVLT